jgi:hypothetical protein
MEKLYQPVHIITADHLGHEAIGDDPAPYAQSYYEALPETMQQAAPMDFPTGYAHANTLTAEEPEYLGFTGTDYSFGTAPTPEEAMTAFREWTAQNPYSTPASPIHQERLAALYDTLDPHGLVAAAAAANAARKATERRAASMATPEADPTRTSAINVADVLGGIASQQSFDQGMDVSSPATDTPAQPETRQPASHRRPSGGRHAAARGGRHAAK